MRSPTSDADKDNTVAPVPAISGDEARPEAAETKRTARGRPRKYPLPDPNAPKRPRGRPRKDTLQDANGDAPPPKKRGRPRKKPSDSTDDEPQPRKKRGRPPKNAEENEARKARRAAAAAEGIPVPNGRPTGSKDKVARKKRKKKGQPATVTPSDGHPLDKSAYAPRSTRYVGIGDSDTMRGEKMALSGSSDVPIGKSRYAQSIQDVWSKGTRRQLETTVKRVQTLQMETTVDPLLVKKQYSSVEKEMPRVEWALVGTICVDAANKEGGRPTMSDTDVNKQFKRSKPILVQVTEGSSSFRRISAVQREFILEESQRRKARKSRDEWEYKSCTPAILDSFEPGSVESFMRKHFLRPKSKAGPADLGETLQRTLGKRTVRSTEGGSSNSSSSGNNGSGRRILDRTRKRRRIPRNV